MIVAAYVIVAVAGGALVWRVRRRGRQLTQRVPPGGMAVDVTPRLRTARSARRRPLDLTPRTSRPAGGQAQAEVARPRSWWSCSSPVGGGVVCGSCWPAPPRTTATPTSSARRPAASRASASACSARSTRAPSWRVRRSGSPSPTTARPSPCPTRAQPAGKFQACVPVLVEGRMVDGTLHGRSHHRAPHRELRGAATPAVSPATTLAGACSVEPTS